MRTLNTIPTEEKKYYLQCSLCDHYYDVRDRGQRSSHNHTQHTAVATALAVRQRTALLAAHIVNTGYINLRKEN
jgi:hypothetical protein